MHYHYHYLLLLLLLLVILLHFAAAAPLLWNILPSYDNLTCPMVSLGSHLKHFFSEQYGHGTVQPVLTAP